jgi:hypothetical protein
MKTEPVSQQAGDPWQGYFEEIFWKKEGLGSAVFRFQSWVLVVLERLLWLACMRRGFAPRLRRTGHLLGLRSGGMQPFILDNGF